MRTSFHVKRVLRQQLEKEDVDVKWPPARVEEHPLLEAFTKQQSENRN
jgi:hypothetical protein